MSFKVSNKNFLKSIPIPFFRKIFQICSTKWQSHCLAAKHDSKHAGNCWLNIFSFALVSAPVVSHSSVSYQIFCKVFQFPFSDKIFPICFTKTQTHCLAAKHYSKHTDSWLSKIFSSALVYQYHLWVILQFLTKYFCKVFQFPSSDEIFPICWNKIAHFLPLSHCSTC